MSLSTALQTSLSSGDAKPADAACIALAQRLAKAIDEYDDNYIDNPPVPSLDKLANQYRSTLIELGLTPKTREQLLTKATTDDKPGNPVDDLKQRRANRRQRVAGT